MARSRAKRKKRPRSIKPVEVKPTTDCRAPRSRTAAPDTFQISAASARSAVIAPSQSGRHRAIVLGLVQLLIVAHVVLWWLSQRYGWWGGYTLTPIEPSEAAETSAEGVINAGFLFFFAALVSTMVFGRWFCGWGCHVVLLQDLCGWLMKRLGVRPKPFRTRWLPLGALGLALYLYGWPLLERALVDLGWLAQELPPWQARLHLTKPDFWATFPDWWLAIPFLFISGFATVYFLGAKGFCTYGCPYGAFFAPLDKLAPGRI